MENFILYKGRGFTSATEARWAAFFDTLGVEWEYGTGGLGLEKAGWCGGLFHLPRLNAWIETRPWPEGLHHGEFWPRHLAWAQGPDCKMLFPQFERLFVICGAPRILASEPSKLREDGEDQTAVFGSRPLAYEAFANEMPGYMWCECPCCGAVGIEMDGRVGPALRVLLAHGQGCQESALGSPGRGIPGGRRDRLAARAGHSRPHARRRADPALAQLTPVWVRTAGVSPAPTRSRKASCELQPVTARGPRRAVRSRPDAAMT